MRCECGNSVLQKSGERVRARIRGPLVFDGQRCTASCYWCKRPVELPVQLKPGTQVSGQTFLISR
jgi:hypothetical protein